MVRNKLDDELNLLNWEWCFIIENLVIICGINLCNGIMFWLFFVEIFIYLECFWNIFILILIILVLVSFGGFWILRNIYKFNIIILRWWFFSYYDVILKLCDVVVFFGDFYRKYFVIYKKFLVCIVFRVYFFYFVFLGIRWYRRKLGNFWIIGNCCK